MVHASAYPCIEKIEYEKRNSAFVVNHKDLERWSVNYCDYFSQGLLNFQSKYDVLNVKEIINRFQYGSSKKANESGEGLPILRMNNIINGQLDIKNIKHISLKQPIKNSLKLNNGDILFNRTNSKELVGKTAVFELDGDWVFASYLIRIELKKEKIEPHYFNNVFNSPIVRNQINAISRKIIGQTNINTEEVGELRIPLPPLKTQKVIVTKIQKIREEVQKLRTQSANTSQSAKDNCWRISMNNKITEEDLEPISMEDFEEAFKKIMLKKPPAKSMYENRRPTKKELEIKWKLEKREN